MDRLASINTQAAQSPAKRAFWDAFIVFAYFQAITKGVSPLMLLFPLIHASLGAWMTYWFAAQFLNRTRLTVAGGNVVVRHWPLPWPGNRTVAAVDVDYVFIVHEQAEERVLTRSRMRHWYRLKLEMKQRDGRTREVSLATLTNPQWAAYTRREIQRRLPSQSNS